ncbi:hypothetical protein PENTCL1PPCAC_27379, partial [Pristionchus entomophagus]
LTAFSFSFFRRARLILSRLLAANISISRRVRGIRSRMMQHVIMIIVVTSMAPAARSIHIRNSKRPKKRMCMS